MATVAACPLDVVQLHEDPVPADIARVRQVMVRGLKPVHQMFVLNIAAYNLVRMRSLEQVRLQLQQSAKWYRKRAPNRRKTREGARNFRMVK